MHASLFVYRMGMHEAQRNPEEVKGEANDYMRLIRPLVIGSHRDFTM